MFSSELLVSTRLRSVEQHDAVEWVPQRDHDHCTSPSLETVIWIRLLAS
jgi:hypothetical protein